VALVNLDSLAFAWFHQRLLVGAVLCARSRLRTSPGLLARPLETATLVR
jgi:hypothetical protein